MMSRDFHGLEEEPNELEIICLEAKRIFAEREITFPEIDEGHEEFQFDIDCEDLEIEGSSQDSSWRANGLSLLSKLDEEPNDNEIETGKEPAKAEKRIVKQNGNWFETASRLSLSLNKINLAERSQQYFGKAESKYSSGSSSMNRRSANEKLPATTSFVKVYHLLGNATTGPSDPFADTKCCICHSMADENLMLLCDLCDSAGHTYCVGLGCTVPEGDWFCHDCAVSRAEHEQSEIDADTDQHISVNCVVIPTAESPVSIFSIIQGSNDSTFERPLPRVGSSMNHFSLPVILEEESSVEHGENREGRRAHQNTAGEAAESCARTFFLRRNVHSRILVLRENWEALRNGSLRFSSNPAEPCGISGKKGDTAAVPHDRSGQPNCPSSVRKQTSQDGTPGCTGHKRKSHDVDKAWKMMDIARSIRLNCGSSSSVHRTSKTLANKGDFSKQSSTTNSSLCLSKDPGLRTGNLGGNGMKKQWISYSKNTETQSHRSCKLENQKQSWFMNGESNGGFPLGKYSSGNYKSTSSRKVQTGNDVTATNSFVKNSHQVSKESGHCSLKTLAEPRPGGFDTLESKVELRVASSSLVDYSEEKVVRRKDGTETKKRQVGDAQNEIQSLVKLNLKLLSGEKRLGVETFKEVAWLATHTILAACGLEHPKPRIRNSRSPSPICSHTDQIHQLHRSTLMPNSCRGCFYVFVKDVVSSFMIGKVGNLR